MSTDIDFMTDMTDMAETTDTADTTDKGERLLGYTTQSACTIILYNSHNKKFTPAQTFFSENLAKS